MEEQNYQNDEDILLEDEDLESGIKGGSVYGGESGDLDEADMPLGPEDQDMTYPDTEDDYSELNDEEM